MDGIRWAWMPVLAILLASCGIPDNRGAEPGREVPETFNGETSTENSSQVGIDEFFGDPILTGLINEGLAGNQNLKILAEDIAIANNEILSRSGAYLPFVTAGGSPRLDKYSPYTLQGADNAENVLPNGQNFPIPLPNFLAAADLTWQIDIWHQLRTARDAAGLRFLGTTEGRNYVVTRLVAEIADGYYHLMALDKRIENLDRTIALQEQSLEVAKAKKAAARDTELPVQRFTAEVRKNQSQKLIIRQEIIETENRINFLLGRFPQPVERNSENFFDLTLPGLKLGLPAQLLQNRPDIRQAERELEAAGLDVQVAKYNFYPRLSIGSGVGFETFNLKYLFVNPSTLVYNVAGNIVSPLINKRAIQAEYMNANARQLQAVYNYQRTVLNAYTEVINRIAKVENFTNSLVIKRQQLDALETSVAVATNLFQFARAEYIDVLFAQRDLMDARMVFIDTKREQLGAIVDTYQALGGGLVRSQFTEPTALPPGATLPPASEPMEANPAPAQPAPDNAQPAPDNDGDNQ
jgi:NodT family efflux transporter outer membrane factor (OMF) lipoprotein